MVIREMVERAAQRLAEAKVQSPDTDAELLAAHVLGVSRGRLSLVDDITDDQATEYWAAVDRRARREPLQHITGVAHFRHISLTVGTGVFIPRPETELTAGAAIDEASRRAVAGQSPVVVDLFAGSGAIALAIADEVPAAQVHAVEASDDAIEWLRRNCADTQVAIHHDDACDVAALRGIFGEEPGVDVVVANPPYVPTDATIRDAEVAEHDPAVALWSGDDGLDAMRSLEWAAYDLLRVGGLVVAEHADVQGTAAPDIFRRAGRWSHVADHDDLTGRPRYLTARKISM